MEVFWISRRMGPRISGILYENTISDKTWWLISIYPISMSIQSSTDSSDSEEIIVAEVVEDTTKGHSRKDHSDRRTTVVAAAVAVMKMEADLKVEVIKMDQQVEVEADLLTELEAKVDRVHSQQDIRALTKALDSLDILESFFLNKQKTFRFMCVISFQ